MVNHHLDEDTSAWYKCAYVITFDNGKCGAMGGGRIKVWTDKKAWLADEPAHLMMHKARSAIHSKAKEHGIELISGFASFAMRFTWPWTMLWQAFMHHVNLVKMEAMKLSLRSFKGHAGRNHSSLRSSWERGSDFANSQAQTFAKQSVLALLEKRCDKSVFREGVLYSRKRACYCLFCIAEMLRGITEWNGEQQNINGCCMSVLGSVGSTENVYTFVRGTCERTS